MKKFNLIFTKNINIMLFVAMFGLLDAFYLSYARYMHVNVPCSITGGGCAVVAASPYAVMFGIPLAYLGIVFYLIFLISLILYRFIAKKQALRCAILLLGIFGALDSLYFLYLQGFVIKAFCIYCILSAPTTFILLFLSIWLYLSAHQKVSVDMV